MRVGLFGGSFDPPHRGHLAVAEAAARAFSLDSILFAPTGRQPLKPEGATATFTDRLGMISRLCAAWCLDKRSVPCKFQPSTLDAPDLTGEPNFAIDTLERLRAQFPTGVELFAIVGADSFLSLRRWRSPEALLREAHWIVVSRPGFSLADLASLQLSDEQRAGVHLLEGIEVPVSATEVRERLGAGMDCTDVLTPEVLDYIREHRLYLPEKENVGARA